MIPRSEGLFTVTVHDLCLDSTGPATVHVQVSDVYGVDIAVVNKVGDIGRCTARRSQPSNPIALVGGKGRQQTLSTSTALWQ